MRSDNRPGDDGRNGKVGTRWADELGGIRESRQGGLNGLWITDDGMETISRATRDGTCRLRMFVRAVAGGRWRWMARFEVWLHLAGGSLMPAQSLRSLLCGTRQHSVGWTLSVIGDNAAIRSPMWLAQLLRLRPGAKPFRSTDKGCWIISSELRISEQHLSDNYGLWEVALL